LTEREPVEINEYPVDFVNYAELRVKLQIEIVLSTESRLVCC